MGVIARQSIKGTLATYLGVAIGFVTTFFVVTRYLTTEEVGLTRVLVDATMLFASLAQLGTNPTVLRYFPWFRSPRDGHHGIFGLTLLVPLAGFLLFALLFILFRSTLLEVYSQKSPLLAEYFYVLPMMTFFMLYLVVFEGNAALLMRISVPRTVREVVIRLLNLMTYLLYGYRVISLDVFVWMFCGSYAAAMVMDMVYVAAVAMRESSGGMAALFRIDWSFVRHDRLWREMTRYAVFMMAMVLAGNIPLLGSLFLGAKVGLAVTGVYTIAYYIANVVEIPNRSLGAIARPVLAAAVKDDNWGEVSRMASQVSLHQMMTSSLMLYLICINLHTLFSLIPNGDDYASGALAVLLLGLGKILISTVSISVDVLNYSRYYTWSLWFCLLLTALSLVANNWLIDLWDINGAAIATLVEYAIYYAIVLLFLRSRLGLRLFTAAHLKMAAVMALLVTLDMLWHWAVAPHLGSLLVDSVIKTVVLGIVATVTVYRCHISASVNAIIDKLIKVKSEK